MEKKTIQTKISQVRSGLNFYNLFLGKPNIYLLILSYEFSDLVFCFLRVWNYYFLSSIK